MYLVKHHTRIGGVDFINVLSIRIQKSIENIIDRATLLLGTAFGRVVLNEQYDFFTTGQYCTICLGYNDNIPLNFSGYLARRAVNEHSNMILEFWDASYLFFHTQILPTTIVRDGDPNFFPEGTITPTSSPSRVIKNDDNLNINLDDPNNTTIVGALETHTLATDGTLQGAIQQLIDIVNIKFPSGFAGKPITLNISSRVSNVATGVLPFSSINVLEALKIIKDRYFLNIYFRREVLHVHPLLFSEEGERYCRT